MNQLFYVSSAKEGITPEEIQHFVDKARVFNTENSLTGVLLFKGSIFLQLIEGDEKCIRELFETKIKKDTRHSNVIEIFDIQAKERLFADWSMGFYEMAEFDITMINEMLSWNKLISAAKEIDNYLILHMLARFKLKL